jgi:hypothetical protein
LIWHEQGDVSNIAVGTWLTSHFYSYSLFEFTLTIPVELDIDTIGFNAENITLRSKKTCLKYFSV